MLGSSHPVKLWNIANMEKTYNFKLILHEDIKVDDDFDILLAEAGCDDASFGTLDGESTLGFSRQATSLKEAINSVVDPVETAGIEISRVEI